MKEYIRKMSHAFYTLLDRMYENMPESCGEDDVEEYVKEVEDDVAGALAEFKAAEDDAGRKLPKKQIVSFNEEYLDISVDAVIPAGEDPIQAFRAHMIKRTRELLDVSDVEARNLLDADDEAAHYSVNGDNAAGSIAFGDYTEFIQMLDVG